MIVLDDISLRVSTTLPCRFRKAHMWASSAATVAARPRCFARSRTRSISRPARSTSPHAPGSAGSRRRRRQDPTASWIACLPQMSSAPRCSPSAKPRPTRCGSRKLKSVWSISTPTRLLRRPRRFSRALASTKQHRRGPAHHSRAAGACALRSRPFSLSNRICCCSTNRPTISTSKARCGFRIISRNIRTP